MTILRVRWASFLEIWVLWTEINFHIVFTNVANSIIVTFMLWKINDYFIFFICLIFAMKPSFRTTEVKCHMVVDISNCIVFPCTGSMKGLGFPIGTIKSFLHIFYKRFTCWKRYVFCALFEWISLDTVLGELSA